MRILYDATPLLMRSAGVKNYHHSLLVRLVGQMDPHHLELFPFLHDLAPNHNERSNYPPFATAWRLGAVLADNYLRFPAGRWAARGADLFHVTHHLMHPPRVARLTAFVHDPTPLLMPEFHTASNVRYFRHFVERVLPRLAGVLAPSQAVKRDLVRLTRFPEDRITVVAHGVDEGFFSTGGAEFARANLSLPERYILFVGAREPRKNLATLARAHELLPEELQRAYPLVVAGTRGWKNAELEEALAGARQIGYVHAALLPPLYAQAAAFVFPSLYEGFGMPLLEAMAAGAPVITSEVSAMPEVVGDAGVLVDPRSPAELARAIERVVTDRALAATLVERGRARARQFTWEKTAIETKTFFEKCA